MLAVSMVCVQVGRFGEPGAGRGGRQRPRPPPESLSQGNGAAEHGKKECHLSSPMFASCLQSCAQVCVCVSPFEQENSSPG